VHIDLLGHPYYVEGLYDKQLKWYEDYNKVLVTIQEQLASMQKENDEINKIEVLAEVHQSQTNNNQMNERRSMDPKVNVILKAERTLAE
jgi:hypothetical protein